MRYVRNTKECEAMVNISTQNTYTLFHRTTMNNGNIRIEY